MNESNELLEWKKGFLCLAIESGDCVVLDSIDEAPSTLTERLNGLMTKKMMIAKENLIIQKIQKNLKLIFM